MKLALRPVWLDYRDRIESEGGRSGLQRSSISRLSGDDVDCLYTVIGF
jgi:hypothetical protein